MKYKAGDVLYSRVFDVDGLGYISTVIDEEFYEVITLDHDYSANKWLSDMDHVGVIEKVHHLVLDNNPDVLFMGRLILNNTVKCQCDLRDIMIRGCKCGGS